MNLLRQESTKISAYTVDLPRGLSSDSDATHALTKQLGDEDKVRILALLAAVTKDAIWYDRAMLEAGKIEQGFGRDSAYSSIAFTAFDAGDFDPAFNAAQRMTQSTLCWDDIAEQIAAQGKDDLHFAAARRAISNIGNGDAHRAVSALIKLYEASEDNLFLEEAKNLSEKIDNTEFKVRAYLNIAALLDDEQRYQWFIKARLESYDVRDSDCACGQSHNANSYAKIGDGAARLGYLSAALEVLNHFDEKQSPFKKLSVLRGLIESTGDVQYVNMAAAIIEQLESSEARAAQFLELGKLAKDDRYIEAARAAHGSGAKQSFDPCLEIAKASGKKEDFKLVLARLEGKEYRAIFLTDEAIKFEHYEVAEEAILQLSSPATRFEKYVELAKKTGEEKYFIAASDIELEAGAHNYAYHAMQLVKAAFKFDKTHLAETVAKSMAPDPHARATVFSYIAFKTKDLSWSESAFKNALAVEDRFLKAKAQLYAYSSLMEGDEEPFLFREKPARVVQV
jgi:hypothetical protein